MKVTLNWLKEFVDISISANELSDILTMAGLEVEEIKPVERNFSKVVVGEIVESDKLPNSDHLSLCQVNIGSSVLQVVCGAPNAAKGLKAPMALDGAVLLNDFKVATRKLRGVESQGMLCSETELGLTNRSEGLMELSNDAIPGQNMSEYLGEMDVMFDIFITPNRPDCLSVIGIAREIAALTGAKLRKPDATVSPQSGDISDYMSVDINNPDLCFRYSGQYLKDIKIGPSPFWMAERLNNVGIRSINNVVDITNYIMMETGQPLHAFDYKLLENKKIIVRTATNSEDFTTLDGKDHKLNDSNLLICDGKKPVALAGVMGGLNSEVQNDTEIVFLESAYFEPANIRITSKKLDLSTESSRRFERGSDPNGTMFALKRAAKLMCEYADAVVIGDEIDNYPNNVFKKEIAVKVANANRLLGTSFTCQQISEILQPIELDVTKKNDSELLVRVPTFRPDLEREVDIIEEIARLYGYNNMPTELSPKINQMGEENEKVAFAQKLQGILVGFGFYQTLNLSLIHKKFGETFLPENAQFVELLNPLSEDLTVFRPSLLVSLLTTVAYNRNRQMHDMRLFEIGNVAWKDDSAFKSEFVQIAGVIAGDRSPNAWYGKAAANDFYDIKAVVDSFLGKLGIKNISAQETKENFWDSESVQILIDEQVVGGFGKLADKTVELFKIKTNDLYAFYLDVNMLYNNRSKEKYFKEIPKYPSVPFDLALIVDTKVKVGDIEKIIWEYGGEQLVDVHLFDYYKGEQIKNGMKSTAFSLTFSSKERTLGDDEIDNVINKILVQLGKEFGAELRQG